MKGRIQMTPLLNEHLFRLINDKTVSIRSIECIKDKYIKVSLEVHDRHNLRMYMNHHVTVSPGYGHVCTMLGCMFKSNYSCMIDGVLCCMSLSNLQFYKLKDDFDRSSIYIMKYLYLRINYKV